MNKFQDKIFILNLLSSVIRALVNISHLLFTIKLTNRVISHLISWKDLLI